MNSQAQAEALRSALMDEAIRGGPPIEVSGRMIALVDHYLGTVASSVASLPEHLRGDGPCDSCGTLDNISWFTDNVFWNAVTGQHLVHEEKPTTLLCIGCFVKRVDAVHLKPTGWRLLPEWPWFSPASEGLLHAVHGNEGYCRCGAWFGRSADLAAHVARRLPGPAPWLGRWARPEAGT